MGPVYEINLTEALALAAGINFFAMIKVIN